MQINAFVLEGSQQALDREVIDPTALAVHADLHLCVHQQIDPIAAGEPAALIRVEYLRCAVLGWPPSAPPLRTLHPNCWTVARPEPCDRTNP